MEHLFFYFGACFMGLISLVSMLAVYRSNKRVLKGLKQPVDTKDKWLEEFIREHKKLQKENTEIHNPSVYVVKRMRGRKIGPWSIRQVKGISWGAFALSFLFIGIQILTLFRERILLPQIQILGQDILSLNFIVITGISMEICLLALRMLLGLGYQEEVIETNLLDYVENRWKEPSKIISLDNLRNAGIKEVRQGKKKEASPENGSKDKEKEAAARQLEQSVLEAAAADDRYSHLLNAEEEAIVKDVIKEFLT